jgi:hypothetical protein
MVDAADNPAALPNPLPLDLTDVEDRNAGAAAQIAKQILIIRAGIETKTSGSMAAAERSVFFKEAYDRWVGAVEKHNDYCPLVPFLVWTTASCSSRLTGKAMYRKFTNALKVIHNEFNPLWKKVLAGNISGRSAEELWEDFLVYLHLKGDGVKTGRTPKTHSHNMCCSHNQTATVPCVVQATWTNFSRRRIQRKSIWTV